MDDKAEVERLLAAAGEFISMTEGVADTIIRDTPLLHEVLVWLLKEATTGRATVVATAELEALRADAERYRWLRHGDNDESVLMTYIDEGMAVRSRKFDHRVDPCWLPRNEDLDSAIDAAIRSSKGEVK